MGGPEAYVTIMDELHEREPPYGGNKHVTNNRRGDMMSFLHLFGIGGIDRIIFHLHVLEKLTISSTFWIHFSGN